MFVAFVSLVSLGAGLHVPCIMRWPFAIHTSPNLSNIQAARSLVARSWVGVEDPMISRLLLVGWSVGCFSLLAVRLSCGWRRHHRLSHSLLYDRI